jgi:heme exporter protein A
VPNVSLSIDGASRKYGEKWGLRPLNASIDNGDFLTLLGPNGAGKSTLLKLLSMQMKPSAGTIHYRGALLSELKDAYRAKIGVISHQPFLYEGLSGLENLSFYASLYEIDKPAERAKELLKRVGMGKRMHDPVRGYSRGMLQRTSIARALLNEPELIFLDEPYTGLDRQASYMLTEILQEQVARQATIVLVTHDLSLGYTLANKVMILAKGECKYFGAKPANENEFEKHYMDIVSEDHVSQNHA